MASSDLATFLPWGVVVLIVIVGIWRDVKLISALVAVIKALDGALGRQQQLPPALPGAAPPIPSLPARPAAPTPPPDQAAPVHAASDNFDACMAFVWPEEGGFSNDPQDHGGPTNLGVTEQDLIQAGMPHSIDDIKALTRPVAAARIYRPFYWNAMHCDELPRGVDLCVFDLGINAGIHEAAKLLQRDVGTTVDGVIGPLTIAAARVKPAVEIIKTFTDERTNFYKSLKQFDRFGRDWISRTNHCNTAALKMAAAVKPGA